MENSDSSGDHVAANNVPDEYGLVRSVHVSPSGDVLILPPPL
ncbi:MAG: hypothetical protein ACLFWR_08830 [Acidimicrobiales bacterium]